MEFFNIILYVSTSVLFYLIIKFVWNLLRLLVFKILVDNFVDFVVEEESDIKRKIKKKYGSQNDLLEKNKETELVNVEKIKKQVENLEDIEQENVKISSPKIVGIKIEVKGKFTQAIANKMRINFQNLDRKTLVEQGYWQALMGLQRGQQQEKQNNVGR